MITHNNSIDWIEKSFIQTYLLNKLSFNILLAFKFYLKIQAESSTFSLTALQWFNLSDESITVVTTLCQLCRVGILLKAGTYTLLLKYHVILIIHYNCILNQQCTMITWTNTYSNNKILVFSRDSDLTTNVVSPSVRQWSKPKNIIQSHFLTFYRDWDRLSTEIDFQLRLTFNWEQLSTEINFQLRSTFNWNQLQTEIVINKSFVLLFSHSHILTFHL